jgi:hypothetical protein
MADRQLLTTPAQIESFTEHLTNVREQLFDQLGTAEAKKKLRAAAADESVVIDWPLLLSRTSIMTS